jgi:hypothetical protein
MRLCSIGRGEKETKGYTSTHRVKVRSTFLYRKKGTGERGNPGPGQDGEKKS